MKNDYTYGEWLWQWYRLYKKELISDEWRKQYERAFILHVPVDLYNKRLVEVTALDIDLALFDMGRTRTAAFMYGIYSASLKRAYVVGFICRDVGSQINKVVYRSTRSKALSEVEIKQFFDFVKDYDVYYFYKFLLLTGCRRSEALAVLRSDIDYKLRILHIRGTKTVNSDRYLPLTNSMVEFLQSIPLSLRDDRLFPFNADYVTKFFKKHVPNHKLHDLRHTFATRCASAGVHPAITQSLLGHSTPEFTLRVYTHINCKEYITDLQKVHNEFKV